MDPSLLLKSSKSNVSSIKPTNLMEHMSLPMLQTSTSPKGNNLPHLFFPPFGSGLDMLSALLQPNHWQ